MQRETAAKETAAILNGLAADADAQGRPDKAATCRKQAGNWTRMSRWPLTDKQFALARRWGEAYPTQANDRTASRPTAARPTPPATPSPRPTMTTTTDTTTTDAKARQYLAEFKALPRRKQRRGINNFVCSRAAGVIDAHGDAVQRPRPAARKPTTPPPAGETQGQAYARLAMEADKRKRGV